MTLHLSHVEPKADADGMDREEMALEVKRMFMRFCDINATVEEVIVISAMHMGKELATYAPTEEAALGGLELFNQQAMRAYRSFADGYAREGHPLAMRNPH